MNEIISRKLDVVIGTMKTFHRISQPEINELQRQKEEESELGAVDFKNMSSKIERKTVDEDSSDNVNLQGIFDKFGI